MRRLVARSAVVVLSALMCVSAEGTLLAQSAEITRLDSFDQRIGDPGEPPAPGVEAMATAYRVPCDGEPVAGSAELDNAGADPVLIERTVDVIAEAGDNTRATAASGAGAMTQLLPGQTTFGGLTTASATAGLYCGAVAEPLQCVQDASAEARAGVSDVVSQSSHKVGEGPGMVAFEISAFVAIGGFADEVQLFATIDTITIVVFGSGGMYEAYVFEEGVLVQSMWGVGLLEISHPALRLEPAGYVVESNVEISTVTASAVAALGSVDVREVEVQANTAIANAKYVPD